MQNMEGSWRGVSLLVPKALVCMAWAGPDPGVAMGSLGQFCRY